MWEVKDFNLKVSSYGGKIALTLGDVGTEIFVNADLSDDEVQYFKNWIVNKVNAMLSEKKNEQRDKEV